MCAGILAKPNKLFEIIRIAYIKTRARISGINFVRCEIGLFLGPARNLVSYFLRFSYRRDSVL